MKLKKRIAIVTGAARGIGKVTAQRLLQAGARVGVVDLDPAAVDAACAELEASLDGFTTAVVKDVEVTVNARQRVNLALSVGGIGETVQVVGAAKLLESDSSDRGQVIRRALHHPHRFGDLVCGPFRDADIEHLA